MKRICMVCSKEFHKKDDDKDDICDSCNRIFELYFYYKNGNSKYLKAKANKMIAVLKKRERKKRENVFM